MVSTRTGSRLPRPTRADRSTVISVVAIGLGALFLAAEIVLGRSSSNAITMADIDIAVPGALVAVALLLTHSSGRLNLPCGGAYAVALVLLGRSPAPGDLRVLAMVLVAIIMALLTGLVVNNDRAGTLGSVLVYFFLVDVSLEFGGASSRTSALDESVILRILSGSFGPLPRTMVVAIAVTAGTSFLLSSTDFGRRVRAYGLDPDRLDLVGGTRLLRPSEPIARAHSAPTSGSRTTEAIRPGLGQSLARLPAIVGVFTGLLIALAATSSLVRLGTSGTPGADVLLLRPLAAVVIGNGGLGRTDPSPTRVFVAYLLIHLALAQLRVEGLSSITSDLAIAAVALTILVIARDD